MMGLSPLPWGEGGESSEPGEGFLRGEPRGNFGIRDWFASNYNCRFFAPLRMTSGGLLFRQLLFQLARLGAQVAQLAKIVIGRRNGALDARERGVGEGVTGV